MSETQEQATGEVDAKARAAKDASRKLATVGTAVKHAALLAIADGRVALGVIGIIYESRPNVTVDAAALCLKAGNAVILRGGSEAIHSNIALTRVIADAAEGVGIPPGSLSLIESTDRAAARHLMTRNG